MTSKQPRRSEIRFDLRFEIYDPNYICYHVCLNCFEAFFHLVRRRKNPLISARVAGASLPQLKITCRQSTIFSVRIPESGRLFEEFRDLLQLRDRLLGVAAVLQGGSDN